MHSRYRKRMLAMQYSAGTFYPPKVCCSLQPFYVLSGFRALLQELPSLSKFQGLEPKAFEAKTLLRAPNLGTLRPQIRPQRIAKSPNSNPTKGLGPRLGPLGLFEIGEARWRIQLARPGHVAGIETFFKFHRWAGPYNGTCGALHAAGPFLKPSRLRVFVWRFVCLCVCMHACNYV